MSDPILRRSSPLQAFLRSFGPATAPAAQATEKPAWLTPSPPAASPPVDREALVAARSLPHGAVCDETLRAALDAEIYARRAETDTLDGPQSPKVTGELRVHSDGLPDWWREGGNLMLCGPEAVPPEVSLGMLLMPASGAIVVMGAGARVVRVHFVGDGGLVVIGDGVFLNASSTTTTARSTILIGERTTATWMASIDARNGGIVVVGDDGMWAPGCNFMTDDSHAIRDAETGARINRYGGRIMVERHVWLGDQTRLMGDCRVGHDAVVGQGSFVKNVVLPANTVSVGRPARPARRGITWAREDLP